VAGLAGREVPEADGAVPGRPLVAVPPWRGAPLRVSAPLDLR